jgi:hypothetical protein
MDKDIKKYNKTKALKSTTNKIPTCKQRQTKIIPKTAQQTNKLYTT